METNAERPFAHGHKMRLEPSSTARRTRGDANLIQIYTLDGSPWTLHGRTELANVSLGPPGSDLGSMRHVSRVSTGAEASLRQSTPW
jgi:hypothetical protein